MLETVMTIGPAVLMAGLLALLMIGFLGVLAAMVTMTVLAVRLAVRAMQAQREASAMTVRVNRAATPEDYKTLAEADDPSPQEPTVSSAPKGSPPPMDDPFVRTSTLGGPFIPG